MTGSDSYLSYQDSADPEGPTRYEIEEIESAYQDVRFAFDELEYQVSRFSDGSTNWRYVVSEAEFALDDLESRLWDLESAVSDAGVESDVDVGYLRSQADWLRSEIERFRTGSDWNEVVPNVESETWGMDGPLYNVEDDIGDLEVYDEYDDW